MPAPRTNWTNKKIALLTQLRSEGKSSREIADVLGPGYLTRAVREKISHLKLPPIAPPGWPEDQANRLRELWADGISAGKIAKILGISRSAVIGKVDRLNLPGRTTVISLRPPEKPRQPKRPRRAAKQVTLPPLPINRPEIVADAKPLKAEAWLPLPGTEPKRLHEITDHIGKPDRPGSCRWPIGENPTLFCGCMVEARYCDAHAALAYSKEKTA